MKSEVNVLYFSATGGTEKVIMEIAEKISDKINVYNITLSNNRLNYLNFGPNDVVIVGVPVYAGRIPEFLLDYFSTLQGNNTLAVFVTVYGNRDYDDALLELKNTFENNGFKGIAAGAFIAEHSYTSLVGTNRPDTADLKLARKFGEEIKAIIDENVNASLLRELFVKGSFPYKERSNLPPIVPSTNISCINCGLCAKSCPVEAIDFNNFSVTNATKCISCCSCIKKCPVNAKFMNHELFAQITNRLIKNFSTIRHEPEWFK